MFKDRDFVIIIKTPRYITHDGYLYKKYTLEKDNSQSSFDYYLIHEGQRVFRCNEGDFVREEIYNSQLYKAIYGVTE